MNTNNNSHPDSATTQGSNDDDRQPTLRELMRAHKAKEAAARQPAVAEALEGRRLCAVTANLSGGVLTVTGDTLANNIGVGLGTNMDVYDGTNLIGNFAPVTSITVFGMAGADTITISSSSHAFGTLGAISLPTTIDGGDGNDTIYGADANDSIIGGLGNDTIYGYADVDIIKGDFSTTSTSADANLNGYADLCYGGDGNDTLYGQTGYDTVYGDGDVDVLYGDYATATSSSLYDASDYIDCGTGSTADVVYGDSDGISASYGLGHDTINGSDGGNLIYGEAPNSTGPGNDSIDCNGGNDTVYGGYGNDSVWGEGGSDLIYGSDGADTIDPGTDGDNVFGGNGDDLFTGLQDDETDSVDGGAGSDTFNFGSDAFDVLTNM